MKDQETETGFSVVEAVARGGAFERDTADLDEEKYRVHLASLSLTWDQENELLQALWLMMRAFVDLGFGHDPVHVLFDTASKGTSCGTQTSLQEDDGLTEESARTTTEQNTNKGELE